MEPQLSPISSLRTQLIVAATLAAVAFFLYFDRLDYVPPSLAHDEIIFSLHAHAIATTARDIHGRFLPLFFEVTDQYWATPVCIYTTALFLTALPLTETVVRTPQVLIGALDVALVYLLTLRIFRSHVRAVLAAVILGLTPAHMIHSRIASDLIFPVPFLLAGMLAITSYFERRQSTRLVAGTGLMGVGFYSYLGASAAMPLYFLLMCVLLVKFDARPIRAVLLASAGFAVPMLALVPWLLSHPSQFNNQIQMYGIYDSSTLSPLAGALNLLSYPSLEKRAILYYHFFDPVFLFVGGDPSLMNSTRQAGVLLKSLAVLLPVGAVALIRFGRSPGELMIIAGIVLAPVGALLVPEVKINRALIFLPLAAIVAASGAATMWRARFKGWAVVAVVLLIAVPREFRAFHHDYMGEYRARSAPWFERNMGAALEEVIARDREQPVDHVYVSRTPRWIDWYWKWYLAKWDRTALLLRTTYPVPSELDPATLPADRRVIIGEAEEVQASTIFTSGATNVREIRDASGHLSFIVFER